MNAIGPARSWTRLAAVLVLATSLAGCGAVSNYLGGEDNSEPPAELEEFETTLEVATLWSRRVGSGVSKQYLKLRPVVDAGRVFVAGRDGDVSAYTLADGERIWEADLDVPISGGPGVGAGLVLVGTSDGEVLALDHASGELRWRTQVTSEVLAPPAAGSGVVVTRTADGKLFGLDATSGERLWVYDRAVPVLSLRGTSAPLVKDDAAVAGFDSGRVVAVSLADGQPLWETRVALPRGRTELERLVDIDADPVIEGDVIFVVTFQGRVAALDLRAGTIIWRRDMSSHAGLAVDETSIYVTDEESHVWALDRSNSASVWRQKKLKARSLTSPAAVGEHVVVGDFEGYVHWMRRQDGQFVARTRAGDGIISAPIAVGNSVLVYDRGGTLTVFEAR